MNPRMKKIWGLCIMLVCSLAWCSPSYAQEMTASKGVVTGVVLDESGLPVIGA